MKNLIIGIIIGCFITSAFLIPVIIQTQKDKYEFGHNTGQITGRCEAWEFLNNHFETDQYPENAIDSFGAKDKSIYVIQDGDHLTIKTK